jgi:methylase of polypeptide subunit release factors
VAKTKEIAEFGDFQTPERLALRVCHLLAGRAVHPASVIEPTCGLGSLLFAAIQTFPEIKRAVGYDINPKYVDAARHRSVKNNCSVDISIEQGDFFRLDWQTIIKTLPRPVLVIGNPPWVTNAHLGSLGSTNLPEKSNFQGHTGFDAMTGKSNFDISEWMLMRVLEWVKDNDATMAMLCKTAVARKSLLHAWKNDWNINHALIFNIDAALHFGAAVEASLLVAASSRHRGTCTADVYDGLLAETPTATLAFRNRCVLADLGSHDRWKHLQADPPVKWRSGVKHDCSKVMELRREGTGFRNGLDEFVELEGTYLFPMLKSSDVANGGIKDRKRWMLVPQRFVGDDTAPIERLAPKTWGYLKSHAYLLDQRGSSIYNAQCPFSIFGVGDYSFAPWKVAISGFYKRLSFMIVAPVQDLPVMLDDTCYFLPCQTKEEAETLGKMLNSPVASAFFNAFVFWDAKRPITVDLLRKLSLTALAKELKIDLRLLGGWASENGVEPTRKRGRKASAQSEPQLW